MLASRTGGATAALAKLKKEVLCLHSWTDLTEEERLSLDRAITEVSAVVPLCDVNIATFRNKSLYGQYKDGAILLSKDILLDYPETLATLIHEVAHKAGGDGEHSHIAEIERIWKAVYVNVISK